MSNVAILFTGAYRTFDKTYQCILGTNLDATRVCDSSNLVM